MPCDPLSASDVNPPPLPPDFFGGIVPRLPDLNIPFPALPIEDLQELYDTVNMILPPGILEPNLSSNFSKTVMDAVLSLLEKFTPFLMLYTFFMPILNMILCIIEIICAIPNTFKMIRALIRLFRVCIPEFLALFPFFALIIMIISLLLLILTIILYLIERIISFIEQIIKNIEILAQAITSADSDSVIAITIKLGDFLCIFQNLFVLLGAIILIFEIIEKLIQLLFKLPPCDSSDSSDDGCCTPDVCPDFIKKNKEINGTTGVLQYYNTVIQTSGSGNKTIRNGSLQFYDPNASQQLAFNNIIHAFDLPKGVSKIFFPQGVVFTGGTSLDSAPYTVDIRFFYDPVIFGRTDPKGARFIRITNCIVLKAPTDGILDYQNHLQAPKTGTLLVSGGTAFEDDGKIGMKVSSTDDAVATIDTIVALPDNIGTNPILLPTDGIKFTSLTYDFKINHIALIQVGLITLSCHPDVAFNRDWINNTVAGQLNSNSAALASVVFPDVQATRDCVNTAISQFRTSVSVDSATTMQTTVLDCLNTLKDQTTQALKQVIDIGFDPYKSDFTLDPTIQFTTLPINVSVSLNESGGNNIATNLPSSITKGIASNIKGIVSIGTLSSFDYDGYGKFIGKITSKLAGNGKIKISYNNQFISMLNNPSDITQNPSVSIKELSYTFVQSPTISESIRRDDGDIARNGAE